MSTSTDGCGVGCELGCGFALGIVIVILLFGQCSARTLSKGWHEWIKQEQQVKP